MTVVSAAGTETQGSHLIARVRRPLGTQEGVLLLLLVLVFVGVGLYNERFLAWNNGPDLFTWTPTRRGRHRHVDGDHHGQHRHLRRRRDRGVGDALWVLAIGLATPPFRSPW